jgi:hypothetical protein
MEHRWRATICLLLLTTSYSATHVRFRHRQPQTANHRIHWQRNDHQYWPFSEGCQSANCLHATNANKQPTSCHTTTHHTINPSSTTTIRRILLRKFRTGFGHHIFGCVQLSQVSTNQAQFAAKGRVDSSEGNLVRKGGQYNKKKV